MNEKNIKSLSDLVFSDEDFEINSIEKMANIPSRPSAFGDSSLTPADVKKRFDFNTNKLREKFNELLAFLPYAGKELEIELPGITTLAALVDAVKATKGTMLQNVLMVNYGNDVIPLSEAAARLIKTDSDNDLEIRKRLPLMSEIDAKRLKAYAETGEYYFSENNWKAFIGDEASGKFGYNRVYVERSKGRGSYGMYALSYSPDAIFNAWYSKSEWAERFAREHPEETFREPYDSEYPLLDSVVQRMNDGSVRVPLFPSSKNDATSRHYVDLKAAECQEYSKGLVENFFGDGETIKDLIKRFYDSYMKVSLLDERYSSLLNDVYAPDESLFYQLSADGESYEITGGDVPTEGNIILGGYINSLPIKSVASNAFSSQRLGKITVHHTIVSFNSNAFPSTAGYIKSVNIKNLEAWCNIDFGGWAASPVNSSYPMVYLNGLYLSSLEIPDTVKIIKSRTFAHFRQFTSVRLPSKLTKISAYAFQDCNAITEINIPESVGIMEQAAFQRCTGLKTVIFNGSPSSINSIAFDGTTQELDMHVPWEYGKNPLIPFGAKNATVIYQCFGTGTQGLKFETREGKLWCTSDTSVKNDEEIRFPSVHEGKPIHGIGAYSAPFSYHRFPNLKNVVIPATINSIEKYSFESSPVNTVVFLGKRVIIDSEAFRNATQLKEIFVPWKYGEKTGAPWGAKNATIFYESEWDI